MLFDFLSISIETIANFMNLGIKIYFWMHQKGLSLNLGTAISNNDSFKILNFS